MTDNDIVKALECCTTNVASCKDCPAFVRVDRSNCKKYFRGAIYLINRQKAEIEKLESDLETLNGQYLILDMAIETAKAEAYKECIEKVKDFLKQNGFMFCSDADNILKEMEGEK